MGLSSLIVGHLARKSATKKQTGNAEIAKMIASNGAKPQVQLPDESRRAIVEYILRRGAAPMAAGQ